MATTSKLTDVNSLTVDNGKIKTSYTETRDSSRHTVKTVDGHDVHVDQKTTTDDRISGDFDDRVMALIDGAIKDREDRENERANKRNINRLFTLIGALVIGLMVTFTLTTPGILSAHTDKLVGPYAFTITILMDSGLAIYGLIKHY